MKRSVITPQPYLRIMAQKAKKNRYSKNAIVL